MMTGLGGDTLVATLFWTSVAIVIYVYAGYPLTLLLFPARRRGAPALAPATPRVSILIAAHNEEREIQATVENKLSLEYPRDRIEIVVVSDGSVDRTDEIVRAFEDPRVQFERQEPRQGKTAALNRASARASGDILLVSDANSRWDAHALRRLVEAFADPEVGYATGTLMYLNPGDAPSAASCGLYMRYENVIRRLETRIGSVVGVNGGIDAVRRNLYRPMRADQLPDFILPLEVIEQRRRVVYCPEAIAYESALEQSTDELRMRIRVSLRALRALVEKRHLLGVGYGRFAFQLLVHKVLRYTLFVPLTLAFVANAALRHRPLYLALFVAQLGFYGAAALGLLFERGVAGRLFRLPAFFLVTNIGAAIAVAKLLRGERQVQWQPRKGA
jgi:cellulose synthase/poly-beta-1,6-N-acetylglucosamine synthase-like glycosyltransferase